MTYGMQLDFKGFPSITTSNIQSLYPLGMHFFSGYRSSYGSVGYVTTYPRSAPTGAEVHTMLYSSEGSIHTVDAGEQSTQVSLVDVYKEYAGYSISFADCREMSFGSDWGISFGDEGVSYVLAHPPIAPMRVSARYTVSYPAQTAGYQYDFRLDELSGNIEGTQDFTIFVGIRGREYTPVGTLLPVSGNSFSSGAILRVELLPSSVNHGSFIERTAAWGGGAPAVDIHILVASTAGVTPTEEWGIRIFNDAGVVSMSEENVPLFGKGVFPHAAYTNSPAPWGDVQPLPDNLKSSDLVMFPVCMFEKSSISYRSGNTVYNGSSISYFSGDEVRSSFFWDSSTYSPSGGSPTGYFVSSTRTGHNNGDFMYEENPVMLVDGEDYFVLD